MTIFIHNKKLYPVVANSHNGNWIAKDFTIELNKVYNVEI